MPNVPHHPSMRLVTPPLLTRPSAYYCTLLLAPLTLLLLWVQWQWSHGMRPVTALLSTVLIAPVPVKIALVVDNKVLVCAQCCQIGPMLHQPCFSSFLPHSVPTPSLWYITLYHVGQHFHLSALWSIFATVLIFHGHGRSFELWGLRDCFYLSWVKVTIVGIDTSWEGAHNKLPRLYYLLL